LNTFIRPPGTLVPEGLMFYNRCFIFYWFIYLFRHRISELRRPIAAKFYHVITIWVHVIMQIQKFRGLSPKKSGPKTCDIWRDFTQLPTLIANISRMRQDIQNRKVLSIFVNSYNAVIPSEKP